MMAARFREELNYFIENQDELVKRYPGKVLVLVGRQVVEAYDSMAEAYVGAQKSRPLGTFMLQQCVPGEEAYTSYISSTHVVLA